MSRILILGASGRIAQFARAALLADQTTQLTLFAHHARKLTDVDNARETVVEGDAANVADLTAAMNGVDVVYANLAGRNIKAQAQAVVSAMKQTGVRRLIWISTLGIYDEVPGKYGEWNHQMLDDGYLPTYRAAAQVIEESDLDYTIIRPAWLQNNDEVEYELTQKGEPFKGTEVSRKSIGTLVAKIALAPTDYVGASLGVDKPGTDGDKPAWY
ncbi:SDR family oxidoreductase [Furfurilactobacillus entadae]|uniref:SDR family oxidoreductase n=1 Tax=Furfurilactobacillus entadae TaxID=2922307 RepID=UPI0035E89430